MEPLSKKEEKLINSLKSKKYREREGLFIIEGLKMVREALSSNLQLKLLVLVDDWKESINTKLETKQCDERTMGKISALSTPPGILAVVEIPEYDTSTASDIILAIEDIKDPGNLGTIIRTADAFGVQQIICSPETVDFYNPKVVQASMGAIFRVKLKKADLSEYLMEKKEATIYATHLNGINMYESELKLPAVVLLGNESKGLSDRLVKHVTHSLKIPIAEHAESFNVSIANAIVLGEFRRQFPL